MFGDNTFLSHGEQLIHRKAEEVIQSDFVLIMPLLPSGKYSITIAIANGNQEIHEQHHWINDAIFLNQNIAALYPVL